jgi:hypothetical protein
VLRADPGDNLAGLPRFDNRYVLAPALEAPVSEVVKDGFAPPKPPKADRDITVVAEEGRRRAKYSGMLRKVYAFTKATERPARTSRGKTPRVASTAWSALFGYPGIWRPTSSAALTPV